MSAPEEKDCSSWEAERERYFGPRRIPPFDVNAHKTPAEVVEASAKIEAAKDGSADISDEELERCWQIISNYYPVWKGGAYIERLLIDRVKKAQEDVEAARRRWHLAKKD